MEMSEAWPDTYNEGYTYQFQPDPTHKIHLCNINLEGKFACLQFIALSFDFIMLEV